MGSDNELRHELANLLLKRQAHMDFEDAVANFPPQAINSRPPQCDYSFWHLLEHMRIAQRDILDYVYSDDYVWRDFPDGYWPDKTRAVDLSAWQETAEQFLADRRQLAAIVLDPATDLFAPLPNSGERKHTIVREIHVIAAHNSYHTGELGILRQVMGLWNAGENGQ
ncbi:MAG: DinB family protein [Candidatus Promineifilaceae bacterium]